MKDDTLALGMSGMTLLIFLVINAVIGGFLWPYTLNTWLLFFGKTSVVQFWHGAILGFIPFLWKATIPAAVITWILMLFLV